MEQDHYVSNVTNNTSNNISNNGQHSPSSSISSSSSCSSSPSSATVMSLFAQNNNNNNNSNNNNNNIKNGINKLSETLQMQQRSFNNNQFHMNESSIRELQKTLSTASCFGLRQDHMYNLPANLLHHFQPHFMPPNFSAFKPLGCSSSNNSNSTVPFKNFSSAFSPPNDSSKCLKIDTIQSIFQMKKVHQHVPMSLSLSSSNHQKITSPQSPAQHSPPSSFNLNTKNNSAANVKEENADFQKSSENEIDRINCNKQADFFRISSVFGNNYSTTANTYMIPSITDSNFSHKTYGVISNLQFNQGNNNKRKRNVTECPVCGTTLTMNELNSHFLLELDQLYKFNRNNFFKNTHILNYKNFINDVGSEGRQEAFERIKRNRQSRLKLKIRKRKCDEINSCSICSDKSHESDQCLQKNQNDEDETVDIEGDDETENCFTEWTPSANNNQESEMDNIKTILSSTYERDSAKDITKYDQSQVDTVNSSVDIIDNSTNKHLGGVSNNNIQCDSSNNEPNNRLQLILDLRRKIQQLENETSDNSHNNHNSDDHFKCQICTELYKKPVVSITCWHVHCESCWDKVINVNQLCPQCHVTIKRDDLRTIFL